MVRLITQVIVFPKFQNFRLFTYVDPIHPDDHHHDKRCYSSALIPSFEGVTFGSSQSNLIRLTGKRVTACVTVGSDDDQIRNKIYVYFINIKYLNFL